MTGGQQVELGLHAVTLNLQLPALLFAFLFRMSAANSRQAVFDILRLQILIQFLQTRLQFRLSLFYST